MKKPIAALLAAALLTAPAALAEGTVYEAENARLNGKDIGAFRMAPLEDFAFGKSYGLPRSAQLYGGSKPQIRGSPRDRTGKGKVHLAHTGSVFEGLQLPPIVFRQFRSSHPDQGTRRRSTNDRFGACLVPQSGHTIDVPPHLYPATMSLHVIDHGLRDRL